MAFSGSVRNRRSVRVSSKRRNRSLRFEPLEGRLLLDGAGFGPPAWAGPPGDNLVPGQYIVTLHEDVDSRAFARELRGQGREVSQVYGHALNGLAFRGAQLDDDPRIRAIEQDLILHTMEQVIPTGVQRIEADLNPIASNTASESIDVGIAILDTGIDKTHPDLNVAGGINLTRGNRNNWNDGHGHGTHVAGTVAALDNGFGVVGVAPGAPLYGVKVLNNNGSGFLSDIIAGVDWVTANRDKIAVANMSLGGQGQSVAFRTAIQESVASGVVYVVAAGNSGMDVYGSDGKFGTSDDFIPASYPEVATISALVDTDGKPGGFGSSTSWGADDSFASFSNFSTAVENNPVESSGAAIDLMLPGVNIYSTYKSGGYATMSGTSMAAPHAAGLAALYIAENGRAEDAEGVRAIRQALIDGGVAQDSAQGLAVPNDPDDNPENIGWAVPTAVTDIAITSISTSDSVVVQGDSVSITVTVENVGNQDVEGAELVLTADPDAGLLEPTSLPVTLAAGASAPFIFSWDTSGVVEGAYELTTTISHDDDQNLSNNSASTTVTVEAAVTDLAVTEIVAPEAVVQNDVVEVSVRVDNVGNQDVDGAELVLTADAGSVTPTSLTVSLAAGESGTFNFSWNTADVVEGAYELTATVSHEDEHLDSASTTVSVEAAVTDLALTEIVVPESVVQGDKVEVRVMVENVGNQDVDGAEVRLAAASNTGPGSINLSPLPVTLAAGTSASFTFWWDTTGVDPDSATLRAGVSHEDDENSSNNWMSTAVEFVAAVTDLSVTEIVVPTSVVQGDVVDVSVTVTNVGNQKVEAAELVLTATPDAGSMEQPSFLVTLDAGESKPFVFSWNTADVADGAYELTATVSHEDDENPNNNSLSADVTVEAVQAVSVGDLTGTTDSLRNQWWAIVTIAVVDGNGPVQGVTVEGAWSGGTTNGKNSCETDASGTCTVTSDSMHNRNDSVTWTVTGLVVDGENLLDDNGGVPAITVYKDGSTELLGSNAISGLGAWGFTTLDEATGTDASATSESSSDLASAAGDADDELLLDPRTVGWEVDQWMAELDRSPPANPRADRAELESLLDDLLAGKF